MHILLIHQAFAALDEPGGTRHHEFARALAARGHRVTVIASRVSYLTGAPLSVHSDPRAAGEKAEQGGVRVIRAASTASLHKSFIRRVFAFISFMTASFFIGLGVKNVDVVWGTSPPIFQGITAWLLARLKRVPFLFEVRDLWPQFAIAVGVLKNPILIKLSLWLERFLYRRADRGDGQQPRLRAPCNGTRRTAGRTRPQRRRPGDVRPCRRWFRFPKPAQPRQINLSCCMLARTACRMTWGLSWNPP